MAQDNPTPTPEKVEVKTTQATEVAAPKTEVKPKAKPAVAKVQPAKEELKVERPLDITNSEQLKEHYEEVVTVGNPDQWRLICKASFGKTMKSTKGLAISGRGVLIQVTTKEGEHIAEALEFIPGAKLTAVTETVEGKPVVNYWRIS